MPDRTVILHHHLFKNAGTSADRILRDNFAGRWVTAEFPGQNNTDQVTQWIADNPQAVAFSSHTMMGPLPRISGVRIVSLVLLRDPVARIRSAYRFERRQDSDNFGAVLAKVTDLEGYVRVRLSLRHDRQCRNFQTWRLASLVPGPEAELGRAKEGLRRVTVAGLVDDFDGAMRRLKEAVAETFPDFRTGAVRVNVSDTSEDCSEAPEIGSLIAAANSDDCALLRHAGTLVGSSAPTPPGS